MSKRKHNTEPPSPHMHGLAAPRKPIKSGSDRLRDALGLPADSAIDDVCEEAVQTILNVAFGKKKVRTAGETLALSGLLRYLGDLPSQRMMAGSMPRYKSGFAHLRDGRQWRGMARNATPDLRKAGQYLADGQYPIGHNPRFKPASHEVRANYR